jgi:hydroxyacylglutathione hydrolase
LALKESGDVTIIGPKNEKQKIPGIDVDVGEGDVLDFAGSKVVVVDVGGHTKGHVSSYFLISLRSLLGTVSFRWVAGRCSKERQNSSGDL